MSSQVSVCMWVGIAWSLVLTDARAKRELKWLHMQFRVTRLDRQDVERVLLSEPNIGVFTDFTVIYGNGPKTQVYLGFQ